MRLRAPSALLALIGLLAVGGSANAYDLNITLKPYYMFGGSSAQIVHVPEPIGEQERRDLARRDALWTDYCKPVPVEDDLGVTHLVYAHDGCEFGRDH